MGSWHNRIGHRPVCFGYRPTVLIAFFATMTSIPAVSSFLLPHRVQPGRLRPLTQLAPREQTEFTWAPQDLTKDCPGFLPIPEDDYVKKYQRNPELWPVEFFVIAYRRAINKHTGQTETQVLVRKSANGTSKYGVGTGVPATRWLLSTATPPLGYKWSQPDKQVSQKPARIRFDASNFPEFPKNGQQSWAYDKIEICADAFNGPDAEDFKDPALEEFAERLREGLRQRLHKENDEASKDSWKAIRNSVVKNVVDKANSVAAIQGTLRMSGLFQHRQSPVSESSPPCHRYIELGEKAPDPTKLVQSMRVYTMFPQMPDPMPSPTTPPDEIQEEIASRDSQMAESGRDPHKDQHGRKYTHKSTPNVSNTIHGIYLTLDATDLPGLEVVPALDLFGTKEIKREWKSLQDLKVLDPDGKRLCTEDTKPTFISGFIVRQLVKEGVIDIEGP